MVKHDRFVGSKIYDTQRSVFKAFKIALSPYGITPGQFNVLNNLDDAGELSQKEIAECTHKEQATITRYLDILERKTLVVRTRHKNDRRAYTVTVTDKAKDLLQTIDTVASDCADRLVDNIDKKDLDTFISVLAQIKSNADNLSQK